jgi:hypothetical protein
MSRFILTVASAVALTVVLSVGSTAEAGKGSGSSHHSITLSNHSIHINGSHHSSSVHINFRARDFRGWSSYCYLPQSRCYGYYCEGMWFYWYEPMAQFLPISYITLYPPINTGFVPVTRFPGAVGVLPVGVAPVGPVGVAPLAGTPALPPGGTMLPQ